jgi:hypothetical protein
MAGSLLGNYNAATGNIGGRIGNVVGGIAGGLLGGGPGSLVLGLLGRGLGSITESGLGALGRGIGMLPQFRFGGPSTPTSTAGLPPIGKNGMPVYTAPPPQPLVVTPSSPGNPFARSGGTLSAPNLGLSSFGQGTFNSGGSPLEKEVYKRMAF